LYAGTRTWYGDTRHGHDDALPDHVERITSVADAAGVLGWDQ
jgi:hypothetical protein